MNPTIPKWIIGLLIIMALAAFGISFQIASAGTFSLAARNAIPAIMTIVTLAFFRKSIIAYLLILAGRLTIEISDLVTGLMDPSSPEAGMIPMVIGFLVIELIAIYVLVTRLNKEEAEAEKQVA